MDLKQVRKTVGKIKSTLFKNANAYSIGMLKSHFRGTGLQFKEHRVYSFGDDVRFIDWKMLAKTNHPYVKTFEEERNVDIAVIVDASISMFCGYENISKLQVAVEICCLLYLLASETSDYVTAVIIKDGKIQEIPKSSGEAGIAMFISFLEKMDVVDKDGKVKTNRDFKNIKQSDFSVDLIKHLKRKREIVILSDLVETFELDQLKKIIYQKNVHCFQILSPLDEKSSRKINIFSKGNIGKSKFNTIKSDGIENFQSLLGKKLRQLKVQERYLETFIKEML